MTPLDLKRFRLKHNMTPATFAAFLGLRAKDAQRSVYGWDAGTAKIPDPVAQIVRLAEIMPEARLVLAGQLSK